VWDTVPRARDKDFKCCFAGREFVKWDKEPRASIGRLAKTTYIEHARVVIEDPNYQRGHKLQKMCDQQQVGLERWRGGGGFAACEMESTCVPITGDVNDFNNFAVLVPLRVQINET
jgi:hypothetical protein